MSSDDSPELEKVWVHVYKNEHETLIANAHVLKENLPKNPRGDLYELEIEVGDSSSTSQNLPSYTKDTERDGEEPPKTDVDLPVAAYYVKVSWEYNAEEPEWQYFDEYPTYIEKNEAGTLHEVIPLSEQSDAEEAIQQARKKGRKEVLDEIENTLRDDLQENEEADK